MREKVFLLFGKRCADINGIGEPIVLAPVTVGFLQVLEIFAHPWFIAAPKVDQRCVTLSEVLAVIVHKGIGALLIEPGDHFQILFEEILLDRAYLRPIAVFTNQVNLLEL